MKNKIIIDTNVIVSSFLFAESTTRRAFDHAKFSGVILFSEATFTELEVVLHRQKFDRYVPLAIRQRFLKGLRTTSQRIDTQTNIDVCRDPKDNKFLALALDGQADYLITGDRDLLVLHPFQKTKIVTPADFLLLA